MGNPLTLPVRGLSAAIENASYNSQRRAVEAWLTTHQTGLRAEQFDGLLMAQLLETLPPRYREKVRSELAQAAQHPDFVERATVIVMVHRD